MAKFQQKIVWLTVFAICMANVEASLVVHLRSIYYSNNPLEIFPLKLLSHRDLYIELFRELSTIAMILSVSLLSVPERYRQFGVFLFVFGLWDIFYYIWLKIMIGWPVSWMEWDVLFLIPWPWLAPWISAACIAILMVAGGVRILVSTRISGFDLIGMLLLISGVLICLASFLLPAWPLLEQGEVAFKNYMPGSFSWPVYISGYALMAGGLWTVVQEKKATD